MLEPGLEVETATAVVCHAASGKALHQGVRIGWSISGQHFLIALHALLQHVLNLGHSTDREIGKWHKMSQLIVSMGVSPHLMNHESSGIFSKDILWLIFFFYE